MADEQKNVVEEIIASGSDNVEKVYSEAVKVANDEEQKLLEDVSEKVEEVVTPEAITEKVEEVVKPEAVKSSITSLFKSKAGELTQVTKDFVDHKSAEIGEKVGKVSDSLGASLSKWTSSDPPPPLPLSDNTVGGDSSNAPSVIGTRDLPSEQQALLVTNPRESKTTSWKNCCGLLDCLKSSS